MLLIMQKFLIVGILVILILFSGCTSKQNTQNTTQTQENQNNVLPQEQKNTGKEQTEQTQVNDEVNNDNQFETEWQVLQEYVSAIKSKDIDKANKVAYEKIDLSDCEKIMQKEQCYIMLDFMTKVIESKKKEDFKGVYKDEKQTIIYTEPQFNSMFKNYERVAIYFVKDPNKKILMLKYVQSGKINDKDKDSDLLMDYEENCEDAAKYDPKCITTNPESKDTDGDGWLDSVEIIAGTNPNDKTSVLNFK